jgi:type II secretory pathway pseudopilin PulG
MMRRDRVDEEKKKTKRRMGVMTNTTYFSHPSFRFLLPIFLLSLPSLRALRALRGLSLLSSSAQVEKPMNVRARGMNMENGSKSRKVAGFSLVELLITITVLMIITGLVLNSLSNSLKMANLEKNLAARDAQVKRAVELMSIELAQAGVTPVFTSNPDPQTGTGPVINVDLVPPATVVPLSSVLGFYPGRPITLTLPEGGATSEERTVNRIDGSQLIINTSTEKLHAKGDAVSSPMLPNIYGILNPPSGTEKTVTRLGFMGDILGNNSLQYVEYYFNNGSLYRSITPIDGTTTVKGSYELLLDNLNACNFTIAYANASLPIPVAARISILARADVSDEALTTGGERRFRTITVNTEVQLRGTSAAALIWSRNGETALRSMMPPCTGSGFPPCANWKDYPWWSNLLKFSEPLP